MAQVFNHFPKIFYYITIFQIVVNSFMISYIWQSKRSLMEVAQS